MTKSPIEPEVVRCTDLLCEEAARRNEMRGLGRLLMCFNVGILIGTTAGALGRWWLLAGQLLAVVSCAVTYGIQVASREPKRRRSQSVQHQRPATEDVQNG